jgi:transposase
MLATHALDDQQWPPQALLDADKGQRQAERGCRLLKDPQLVASSLYRKKPERMMALLMIMTVCGLV